MPDIFHTSDIFIINPVETVYICCIIIVDRMISIFFD